MSSFHRRLLSGLKKTEIEIYSYVQTLNLCQDLYVLSRIFVFLMVKARIAICLLMRLQKVLIYMSWTFATAHRKAASTYGAIENQLLACAGILFQNEVENISSALVEGFFIKYCWWLKGID